MGRAVCAICPKIVCGVIFLMCNSGDQRGFTLMDVAIMMLIAGLLLVPFMQKVHIDGIKRDRGITQENRSAIERALADYYFERGYYPCPADLRRNATNADYGQEVRDGAGACVPAGLGVVEVNGRDVDGVAPVETLMIGGVPFATLKLPPPAALDGWSAKFTYAVSRPLTRPGFNNNYGVIAVTGFFENPTNLGIIPPDIIEGQVTDRAHYAVISHGENGVGAYSEAGVLIQACPAAGPLAPKERENCNNDFRFYDNSEMSLARDQNYNDDSVSYISSAPTRIWITSTNRSDIVSGVQNIGIGTNTPVQDPDVKLNVVGNIRVNQAQIEDICDVSDPASNCYSPQAIGGRGIGCWNDDPALPGTIAGGMTGVANVDRSLNMQNYYPGARCRQTYGAGVINVFTCPAGQAVSGVSAAGDVTCTAL